MTDLRNKIAQTLASVRENTPWANIPDNRQEQRLCCDKTGAYRSINDNSKDDYLFEADAILSLLADPANISDEMIHAFAHSDCDKPDLAAAFLENHTDSIRRAIAAAFANERADKGARA
jgi:hypothetical protein